MKKLIVVTLLFALLLVVSGCTDASNAQKVLGAQGYKNIEITGYDFFGCSEDDLIHTGFRAVGQNGQRVSGVVCQGLFFKGATVRTK